MFKQHTDTTIERMTPEHIARLVLADFNVVIGHETAAAIKRAAQEGTLTWSATLKAADRIVITSHRLDREGREMLFPYCYECGEGGPTGGCTVCGEYRRG